MKFDIKRRENPNFSKYNHEDLQLVRTFSKKVYDEFGDYIMGIILFGSSARGARGDLGDIDVLLILDDLSIQLSEEVVQTYRIVTERAIVDTSKKLHVVSMKFTAFWEYIRNGDPVGINILRDGVPIVDSGFFAPLQELLRQGRIRPTLESIYSYFDRAPRSLVNSSWHVMQGTLDLYWAAIDACHAALMRMGEVPPSPMHVADMMEEKLVKKKLLEAKYANIMRNFYKLSKMIMHRQIKEITGKQYDQYKRDAKDLVNRMKKFIG
ncbi:nucleotidyltransferase domain-containing protein [Candidatus Woesearchaeota archaeon]|nr:nucleotidyltransferase domain-containing protein [Candidatus Woesearchaeota archaeon]MBW3021848.1 nucleotidyltransferase domain-containing protein [Candidatus Woesearchaeota archaeon]